MANFCIPKNIAEKMKEAAKLGEINIAKMYEMSSAERNEMFQKYVDKGMATQINSEFEKAMISERQDALKSWAEKVFSPEEKKRGGKFNDVMAKIDGLREMGALSPANEKSFLSDLVATELGARVSPEEVKVIGEKSKKLEDLYSKVKNVGDPTDNPTGQLEYFKAKRDMENYLKSLTPQSKLRIATSTIARGNMLFRLGSFLVNINSNNIQGSIEAAVRRVEERRIGGLNNGLLADTIKFHTKIYNETGYDLTRMTSLASDTKVMGEDMSNTRGPGLVRKVGQWYEDVVFNKTQGLPDVVASSLAGSDRANLMSSRIALESGLKGEAAKTKAAEIYKDAMTIEPKTTEGAIVRQNMIADSLRSTNQDKRLLSTQAMKLRNVFNVGDLRLGDLEVPFVKTTANAIQSSLDASGITLPVEIISDLVKTIKLVGEGGNWKSGSAWGEASKQGFSTLGKALVRAGIGITGAFLLANSIKNEDYIGIYPTSAKERELLKAKNGIANSVRIGDHWFSLDWFGPLMAPLVGFLNAKKYGTNLPDYALDYFSGAGYQILKTPGLDFVTQTVDYISKKALATNNSAKDRALDAANFMVNFIQGRAIAGVISDIAKLTDTTERNTSSKDDLLAPIKGSIPGFRQTLPPKVDIFGDNIETEGWKGFLLGGRIKTDRSNAIINELDRLSRSGNLPSISTVSTTSDRAKILKKQVGDTKYNEAMTEYGSLFKKELGNMIEDQSYKDAPDDSIKKNMIDTVKNDIFDYILNKYGYQELSPEEKKKLLGK